MIRRLQRSRLLCFAALAILGLGGCKGIPTRDEVAARKNLQSIATSYRPGHGLTLPPLGPDSGLSNFLSYAILNQPQVEAAYYEWAASVERITQARSRPDPRLTFSADIADVLMELMPGLMVDLPGPGKLRAGGNVASAESRVKYFTFEKAVLQAAFDLKKAYYQLYFLDAEIDVNRQTLELLAQLEKLARAQNEVGKVTLQDALRAQIEQDRLTTEIANLEDSRNPFIAQFKAALGLKAGETTPPMPAKFETTPLDLTSEELLATAWKRNPRIKGMEAEVRMAVASINLARKSRVPDFSLGLEADAYASPTIFTPEAAITLPIWRDKIAAQIAEAQASKRAAQARLSAEEIMIAVEFAEKSFMYRESGRTLELLRTKLLPKARQSLQVAQGGYPAGQVNFLDLIDAQRTLLNFQLLQVEQQVQRELALAELSLLIVSSPPARAPLLPVSETKPTKPERRCR